MKKFWVDFEASILVEAETEEEAKEKFRHMDLRNTELHFAEIEWVEEEKEK